MAGCLNILLLIILCGSAFAGESDYVFTPAKARKIVLDHSREECEEVRFKPRLPYRATFERAMKGDIEALNTVFTNPNYHSGDNESWSFTAWPLLHAVGDERFARYLRSLPQQSRTRVFEEIFYEGSEYSQAIKSGYFARRFPRVEAIYRATKSRK